MGTGHKRKATMPRTIEEKIGKTTVIRATVSRPYPPVQEVNDQGGPGNAGADAGPVEDIEALQPFEHASEDAQGKAEADRGADH